MALSLADIYGNTQLLIYEMEELYPRLIDNKTIERNQSIGNFLLMSTSNYLEKGMYVFFYNTSTNQLSLKEYNGYILNITPKSSEFRKLKPYQSPQKSVIGGELAVRNEEEYPFPENSTIYTLYIESNGTQNGTSEYMLVNIVVRRFDDPSIAFFPLKPLNIDSPYVNFNLSSLAVGPLQRFYIEDNMTDKNIRIQFINYFNALDISNILEPTEEGSPRAIERVKQIALNL